MLKSLFSLLAMLVISLSSFVNFAQADTPITVIVQPEDIFVLKGFDDNDEVEVVISGYLPTLCHQSPTLKYRLEGDQVLITLTALHFDRSNPYCTQVPIPFLEVINVGTLSAGDYRVFVNRDTPFESADTLHVDVAPTQEQNNFTYAMVEYVEKVAGSRQVVLAGTNPSDCFTLDRVEFISNEKNAMAVLPILKKRMENCELRPTPFKYVVEVPRGLERDKILLNVRRMDGKAINTIFNNLQ